MSCPNGRMGRALIVCPSSVMPHADELRQYSECTRPSTLRQMCVIQLRAMCVSLAVLNDRQYCTSCDMRRECGCVSRMPKAMYLHIAGRILSTWSVGPSGWGVHSGWGGRSECQFRVVCNACWANMRQSICVCVFYPEQIRSRDDNRLSTVDCRQCKCAPNIEYLAWMQMTKCTATTLF